MLASVPGALALGLTFLTKPPWEADPWKTIAATNTPGQDPINVPILITHSLLDDVVPYKAGKSVARSWCKKGAKVDFQTMATPTHVGGAIASFPRVFAFLEARFGALPNVALSNCWLL